MNILWKQPNDVLALTSIFDGTDPVSYAQLLQDRGDIPFDWILLDTNVEWSSDTRWKHETYRWNGSEIIVDQDEAIIETQNKLREIRKPLLEKLDLDFMMALEQNQDTSTIVAEKQRLRDLTNIDSSLTLDELYNLVN
jgi:hypothetical protein